MTIKIASAAGGKSMSPENQENMKPTDRDDAKHADFDFSFAFAYKQTHDTSLLVSADQLFDNGMIKPLKDYKDSDPLLPKTKLEKKSSKPSSQKNVTKTMSTTTKPSSLSSSDWCKKWKLKDLLLFRSSSESHASTRYDDDESTLVLGLSSDRRKNIPVKKCGGERRRVVNISAHERHYRKNRAAAEEMRRKTYLPYKKTLMGCSDLDPGVHEFVKGHAVEIKC